MVDRPSWKAGWRKPDRRPIWEWAHDHVTLPASYAQPGRFDVSTSRHFLGPMQAIQDDSVRQATWMGAIQTGKSLISEIGILWAIANSPGPIMLTMQTDEDAQEHCDQRFFEALRSVKAIRDILPADRHLVTKTAIYFGPFFLMVNGANLSNLQRVSIRWKFNSECWLWKQGLLAHAAGRVSAFEKAGNSKVINESQGGSEGDDFHEAYKSGHQAEWSIRCFGCGQLQPLAFSVPCVSRPDKPAGVVWNTDARRADGTWDVARASSTARWECPACGHGHDDTARTRARWNAEGDYRVQRTDAPASIRSFRWESLVARPMGDLVAQFLEARRQQKQGVTQAMMDFTRQRRALPWKDDMAQDLVVLKSAGYLLNSPNITDPIDNEAGRFMTIDRQRDCYYVLVRAWRHDGSSRLLYFSRTLTPEQNEDIRRKFNVEERMCGEDAGYFPDGVYEDCARYGWTALKGSGDNYFKVEVRGVKINRMWSNIVHVQKDNKLVPLIHWASDPIKDVLYNLRTGKGAKWETGDDAGKEYESQLNGDRKKPFDNKKTGRPEYRWQRTHANHAHDVEAMQVLFALIAGILSSPTNAHDVHTAEVDKTPPAP